MKTSFLGTVAVGETVEEAVSSFTRCLVDNSAPKQLVGFDGKDKNYSLLVSSGEDESLPFNPYSGKFNLHSMVTDGTAIAATITLPTKDDLESAGQMKVHLMVCSSCGSFQVADNQHLANHCILCSEKTEEPEDVDDTSVDIDMADEEEGDEEEVEVTDMEDVKSVSGDDSDDDDDDDEKSEESDDDDDEKDEDESEEKEEAESDMKSSDEEAESEETQEAESGGCEEKAEEDSDDSEPEDADDTEEEADMKSTSETPTMKVELDSEEEGAKLDAALSQFEGKLSSTTEEDGSVIISGSQEDILALKAELEAEATEEAPAEEAVEAEAVEEAQAEDATEEAQAESSDEAPVEEVQDEEVQPVEASQEEPVEAEAADEEEAVEADALPTATIDTSSDEEMATAKGVVAKYLNSVSDYKVEGNVITVVAEEDILQSISSELVSEDSGSDDAQDPVIENEADAEVQSAGEEEAKVEDASPEQPEAVESESGSDPTDGVEEKQEADPAELVEVDMMSDSISKDATIESSEMHLMYQPSDVVGGSKWFAIVDGNPVAFATSHSAGQNGEIFHDPKFREATAAVVSQLGILEGLKAMGFKGIRVKMPVASIIESKVEEVKEEIHASSEKTLEQYKEGIRSALATASVGINKGFFANVNNPVKLTLYRALSSMGLKNAEEVIDDAFATSGDEYHKILMAKAGDLLDMPVAAMNEVSMAVQAASYQRATPRSVSSVVSEHLANANAPIPTVRETQEMVSSGDDAQSDRIRSIVKGISTSH